jgi:hypothetical protein
MSGLRDITTEDLIEAVEDFFTRREQDVEAYYESDEYWKEYADIAFEDAANRPLKDIMRHVDDEMVENTIERLRALGANDSDIQELLVEAGEAELENSMYVSGNAIGSCSLPTEEEYSIDPDDQVTVGGATHKISDVLKDIQHRGELDELERRSHLGKSFFEDLIKGKQVQAYIGLPYRMVELIVKPIRFIMNSKRFIKDMKVLKKVDKRFPALTKVMRGLWD